MVDLTTKAARVRADFSQWMGSRYVVDTYWHPEHGNICVCFSRRDPKLKEEFTATHELTGDEGYDSKGIANVLKKNIERQIEHAKAQSE